MLAWHSAIAEDTLREEASRLFGRIESKSVSAATPEAQLGRALFWRGYEGGAPGGALGFGLTFYPTMLLLLACALRLVWRAVA